MIPQRINEIRTQFPWLPADYLRSLALIEPGRRRYGVEWFDGPRVSSQSDHPGTRQAFPEAWQVGRRTGNLLGYERSASGAIELCEWGGSQHRRKARYDGIDALALEQIRSESDARRLVSFTMTVCGMAFGAWRESGENLTAPCMFSPGLESAGLTTLFERFSPGWELLLMRDDGDSALVVQATGDGFTMHLIRHGSFGTPEAVTRQQAYTASQALVPWNDGAHVHSFGRLSVPATELPADP